MPMTKTALALLIALSAACAARVEASLPADAASEDAHDAASEDTPEAPRFIPSMDETRASELRVPINAETLLEGRRADSVELRWDALWRHTLLSPSEALWWSNPPPRDGSRCDGSCRERLIARAATMGGTLPATLRLRRAVVSRPSGARCALVLEEHVELDLTAAVRDLEPSLAPYDFLLFRGAWSALLGERAAPCPR